MGGIDLQLLGIGHDGHIGFNEPGEAFELETHCVDLTAETIEANKRSPSPSSRTTTLPIMSPTSGWGVYDVTTQLPAMSIVERLGKKLYRYTSEGPAAI